MMMTSPTLTLVKSSNRSTVNESDKPKYTLLVEEFTNTVLSNWVGIVPTAVQSPVSTAPAGSPLTPVGPCGPLRFMIVAQLPPRNSQTSPVFESRYLSFWTPKPLFGAPAPVHHTVPGLP